MYTVENCPYFQMCKIQSGKVILVILYWYCTALYDHLDLEGTEYYYFCSLKRQLYVIGVLYVCLTTGIHSCWRGQGVSFKWLTLQVSLVLLETCSCLKCVPPREWCQERVSGDGCFVSSQQSRLGLLGWSTAVWWRSMRRVVESDTLLSIADLFPSYLICFIALVPACQLL